MMTNAVKTKLLTVAILLSALTALPALAKMSVEEAARLKADLTPFGAERAGNSDGSIPEWQGGLKDIPSNVAFDPALGKPLPDPFVQDQPLFTITSKNMDQYADKLSEGQKALLKRYPDSYALSVYPSRRTFAAPQWVYDNTHQNAKKAQLTEDGIGVTGAYGGIAFPLPTKGQEVIYNHMTRWQGEDHSERAYTMIVHADGKKVRGGGALYSMSLPYYNRDKAGDSWDGTLVKMLARYHEPQRRVGESFLILEPLDHSAKTREVWRHLPAQRRVRRAPSMGYDTPNPTFAGVATYDDAYMYNGPIDRFDWKLVGKKELFVPYHNYQFDLAPIDDLLVPNHHNPKFLRWELHRVWVVEASLRKGERHVYGKRIFYIDEDSWINLLEDKYDNRGELWRTAVATNILNYTVPVMTLRATLFYDFQSNLYCGHHLINGSNHAIQHDPIARDLFTPKFMLRASKHR